VPGDLSGNVRIHTSPYHVADSRTSKVVWGLARESRSLAGSLPDFAKFSHLLALSMEDIGTVHSTG
jgi:hypothetical protein